MAIMILLKFVREVFMLINKVEICGVNTESTVLAMNKKRFSLKECIMRYLGKEEFIRKSELVLSVIQRFNNRENMLMTFSGRVYWSYKGN